MKIIFTLLLCTVVYVVADISGICPDEDGATPTYYPDTEDCSVFYECSNGRGYRQKCPPGTHFDTTLDVCARGVDCGDREKNV